MPFNELPSDIQKAIFSFLDFKTLGMIVPRVCKKWNIVSQSDEVWQQKLQENNIQISNNILFPAKPEKLKMFFKESSLNVYPFYFYCFIERKRKTLKNKQTTEIQEIAHNPYDLLKTIYGKIKSSVTLFDDEVVLQQDFQKDALVKQLKNTKNFYFYMVEFRLSALQVSRLEKCKNDCNNDSPAQNCYQFFDVTIDNVFKVQLIESPTDENNSQEYVLQFNFEQAKQSLVQAASKLIATVDIENNNSSLNGIPRSEGGIIQFLKKFLTEYQKYNSNELFAAVNRMAEIITDAKSRFRKEFPESRYQELLSIIANIGAVILQDNRPVVISSSSDQQNDNWLKKLLRRPQ